MLHAGEVLQGRYEIISMIGKGGMSTVYQARDMKSRHLLAIKDVKRSGREQNQVVEQSLTAEGRMLKQLSNPHLPKIYDIIENADNIMLVMDFIQGESLDKVIAREGPQSVERVLDWGMQICEVFHYLHNQPVPIIYRDMKPANVMLQPNGKLMMIDFGTARTEKVGVSMRADTICIGTEGFAAPEQFGGIGQSTARTDIFCLGATLYNMVTGHSPCDRPKGILPLETWNPALANTPISEIIVKCTRNDPNERYQTAMELYEDLHLAATGAYARKNKPHFTNGLRKQTWQKQDVQGSGMITGGLSGLLQRGIGEITGQLQTKDMAPQPESNAASMVHSHGWQKNQAQAVAQNVPNVPVAQTQNEESRDLLHKLTLIAALTAIIFVVLTIVLAVMELIGAAVVFLFIALAAVTASLVCMILSRRQQ